MAGDARASRSDGGGDVRKIRIGGRDDVKGDMGRSMIRTISLAGGPNERRDVARTVRIWFMAYSSRRFSPTREGNSITEMVRIRNDITNTKNDRTTLI